MDSLKINPETVEKDCVRYGLNALYKNCESRGDLDRLFSKADIAVILPCREAEALNVVSSYLDAIIVKCYGKRSRRLKYTTLQGTVTWTHLSTDVATGLVGRGRASQNFNKNLKNQENRFVDVEDVPSLSYAIIQVKRTKLSRLKYLSSW